MKKTIDQLDLNNKIVIIREDLNVPMNGKSIASNARIIAALPTINKAIEAGAKVVIMSHLGRVKEEADLNKKSLKPVAKELSTLLKKQVKFIPSLRTEANFIKEEIKKMNSGDVILMENTRFEDLNDNAESKNNKELAKFWASLGDVFINDAFATSHRSHASNVGIATYIKESALGYLVEKEVNNISQAIKTPKRPFIAIIGGAKVSDKIKTIESLITKVDKLIIGGGMAYTFAKAQGRNMGTSLVEDNQIEFAKKMLKLYQDKIILPVDNALSKKYANTTPTFNTFNSLEMPNDMMGMDIGPKTIEVFKKEIKGAKTIIWNGPLGVTEFSNYAVGTEAIAKAIGELKNAYTVVGGGDSVAAIERMNLEDKFSHISTGGGACLAMLEGSKLPGIEIIQNEGQQVISKKSSNKKSTLELETKNNKAKTKEIKIKKNESSTKTMELNNNNDKSNKNDDEEDFLDVTQE